MLIVIAVLILVVTWLPVGVFRSELAAAGDDAAWLALALKAALLVTVIDIVVVGTIYAYRRYRSHKAARGIERALGAEADAQGGRTRPDQGGEFRELREEFEKAVKSLKASKLGRSGADALGALPWYMIIGPPGGGKSTALRASGLNFPYLSKRGGDKRGVRGIGGTRNCEWWLTNEAVLLDTAGRYATEAEDREEWLGFLEMLRKNRPGLPINGVLVAIPVSDLRELKEAGARELGDVLRERVDEVMARLGVVVPVYLVFTKCDLVPGFVALFRDLRKREREQMWGFTVPLAEDRPAAEVIQEGFEELADAVERRAWLRLGRERNVEARELVSGFPRQFRALESNVSSVVESLFKPNVYQESPILRAVCFTSGTQEGRAIDRLDRELSQLRGIDPATAQDESPGEDKSYFLLELFSKVIFPDRDLARRTASGSGRWTWAVRAAAAGAALLSLALLALPLSAYFSNRRFLAEARAAAKPVSSATTSDDPLDGIEPLGKFIDDHKDGPGFASRLGMYQGGTVLPALRRLYGSRVRVAIVDPVLTDDAANLAACAGAGSGNCSPVVLYDQLKAYLLLTRRAPGTKPPGIDKEIKELDDKIREGSEEWLVAHISEGWNSRGRAGESTERVSQAVKRYASFLTKDPVAKSLTIAEDPELVSRARKALSPSLVQLALDRVVSDVAANADGCRDVNLKFIVGPGLAIDSKRIVRAAFTRDCYAKTVRDRLAKPGKILDPWVVEVAKDISGKIELAYFDAYQIEWLEFIKSIRLRDPSGLPRAWADPGALLKELDARSGEGDYPARAIFRAVAANTRFERRKGASGASSPEDRLEARFRRFCEFGLGPRPVAAKGGEAPQATPSELDRSHGLVVGAAGSLRDATSADPAGTREASKQLRTAREQVQTYAERASDPDVERLIRELYVGPMASAGTIATVRVAEPIERSFCSLVRDWNSTLAARYPVARAGAPEAPIVQFSRFFGPQGVVRSFAEKDLKDMAADVQFVGGRHVTNPAAARLPGGLLPFLDWARDVTSQFFPDGSAGIAAKFRAEITSVDNFVYAVLRISGKKVVVYESGRSSSEAFTWPGGDQGQHVLGASLGLKKRREDAGEVSIAKPGEWGFFQFLELAKTTPTEKGFRATWQVEGGAITIEFEPLSVPSPFGSRASPAPLSRLRDVKSWQKATRCGP